MGVVGIVIFAQWPYFADVLKRLAGTFRGTKGVVATSLRVVENERQNAISNSPTPITTFWACHLAVK
jgi:hypothetical protein